MRQLRVSVWAVALGLVAFAVMPAAAQYENLPPEDSDKLLPDVGDRSGGQYVPPWADPYASSPDVGVNEDPTPFNPADVDANATDF